MTAVMKRWNIFLLTLITYLGYCPIANATHQKLTQHPNPILTGWENETIDLHTSPLIDTCNFSDRMHCIGAPLATTHVSPTRGALRIDASPFRVSPNAVSANAVSANTVSPNVVLPNVEFDRFSSQSFASNGFTPHCVFVDQECEEAFLENEIAGSLDRSDNPIYRLEDKEWAAPDKTGDSYWQYYAHCDQWGVVFSKLEIENSKRLTVPSRLTNFRGKQEILQPQRLNGLAASFHGFHAVYHWAGSARSATEAFTTEFAPTLRELEFCFVELQVFQSPQPLERESIESLKSIRPIIDYVTGSQLVENPEDMIEQFLTKIKTNLSETIWQEMWLDMRSHQFAGPERLGNENGGVTFR